MNHPNSFFHSIFFFFVLTYLFFCCAGSRSCIANLIRYCIFQEVRSKERMDTVCGFPNLGNTCYMNAAIQLLRTAQAELVEGLQSDLEEIGQEDLPPLHRCLFRLFELRGSSPANLRTAGALLNQIKMHCSKVNPVFGGASQCDLHEYLHCLLLLLHKACNRGAGEAMQYKEIADKTKREGDDDAAARWHRIFKARDDSSITDLFTGQLKSNVQCNTCGKRSFNFDPLWELHIELSPLGSGANNPGSAEDAGGKRKKGSLKKTQRAVPGAKVQLQELLNLQLAKEEVIEGFACANCNDGISNGVGKGSIRKILSSVTRRFTVSMLPRYLLLHLRRFTFDGLRDMTLVRIPLVLEVCEDSNGHRRKEFQLVGTAAHHGDCADEGHYTANCLVGEEQWMHCDDECVEMASVGSVCSEELEVYMLLYKCMED
jgi:ubiquitin carboxyl-terminal hydrolase 8